MKEKEVVGYKMSLPNVSTSVITYRVFLCCLHVGSYGAIASFGPNPCFRIWGSKHPHAALLLNYKLLFGVSALRTKTEALRKQYLVISQEIGIHPIAS